MANHFRIPDQTLTTTGAGLLTLILSYAIWGLFPVYWKQLSAIQAGELLFLRLILTALTCLMLMPLRGSWPAFRSAVSDPVMLRIRLGAALLLAANWFSFIWAVNNNRVLESSLGYFLCPLASVFLGYLFEKERLGPVGWLSVLMAAAGVGLIVLQAGRVPLAAIAIAVTWSSYGLMKKRTRLGPVVSLGMETSLLAPIAALVLLVMSWRGPMSIGEAGGPTLGFLALAGFLTAAPLLLFGFAAQRVRLSTMGMGQYIVPSAHFGLAAFYGETIRPGVVAGFACIWIGLGLYSFAAGKGR